MTKESIYELQKINCNCNDCAFLERELDKLNQVVLEDKQSQQELFDLSKARKIRQVESDIENLQKHSGLIKNAQDKIERKKVYLAELKKLKHGYQGQKTPIQYGLCIKHLKEISFIPNICQVETQTCFVHRK